MPIIIFLARRRSSLEKGGKVNQLLIRTKFDVRVRLLYTELTFRSTFVSRFDRLIVPYERKIDLIGPRFKRTIMEDKLFTP